MEFLVLEFFHSSVKDAWNVELEYEEIKYPVSPMQPSSPKQGLSLSSGCRTSLHCSWSILH
jgi:hypothetical protein